mmetsp:Transcript_11329/g.23142  ORF Transcript_11329/g.23142 Transcript_11329/m.23142 type:complete len:300 (-) Transcript_11329:661-1560(-)
MTCFSASAICSKIDLACFILFTWFGDGVGESFGGAGTETSWIMPTAAAGEFEGEVTIDDELCIVRGCLRVLKRERDSKDCSRMSFFSTSFFVGVESDDPNPGSNLRGVTFLADEEVELVVVGRRWGVMEWLGSMMVVFDVVGVVGLAFLGGVEDMFWMPSINLRCCSGVRFLIWPSKEPVTDASSASGGGVATFTDRSNFAATVSDFFRESAPKSTDCTIMLARTALARAEDGRFRGVRWSTDTFFFGRNLGRVAGSSSGKRGLGAAGRRALRESDGICDALFKESSPLCRDFRERLPS